MRQGPGVRSHPSVRPFAAGLLAVLVAVPAALAASAWLHARGGLDPNGTAGHLLAGVVAVGSLAVPFLLIPLLVRTGLALSARRGENRVVAALRAAERTLWWMSWSLCAGLVTLLAVLAAILWVAGGS